MPTYTFETEQGERRDIYMSMSEAPTWGTWVEYGGVRMRRVVETPVEPHVPDVTCVTRIAGFWDKSYPRCDPMGRGVILSKREHTEFKAKHPEYVWD